MIIQTTSNTSIMPITRNLVFLNNNAYDIEATMAWITRMYEQSDQEIFPDYRFENIMATLIDYKYIQFPSAHWIVDPHDGKSLIAALWWANYGMVDHRIEYLYEEELASTIEGSDYLDYDMPLSNDPDSRGMEWEHLRENTEECIEDDDDIVPDHVDSGMEHDMLLEGVRNVAEVMDRNEGVDELAYFGHASSYVDDAIDSFFVFNEFDNSDSDKEN